MHDGRMVARRPTEGARVAAGELIYHVTQQPELPVPPPEG